jgi:methylated-DNA--[protein]-cysteine S-methyltransferase
MNIMEEYGLSFGEYSLVIVYEPGRRLIRRSYWVKGQVDRPRPNWSMWTLIECALHRDSATLWPHLWVTHGTPIQQRAWQTMYRIPYGSTVGYLDLAEALGNKASQGIGQACKANMCLWFIPCHRVIHVDGRIGHYSGGDEIKPWLLALERDYSQKELLDFLSKENKRW